MSRGAMSPPRLLPYGQRDSEVNYSVGRAALNRVLIEAAAHHPQVELRFAATCTDADPTHATLTVRDNRTGTRRVWSDSVTIGADGAGSALRAGLAQRRPSRRHRAAARARLQGAAHPAARRRTTRWSRRRCTCGRVMATC